uniref:ATP synthase F(0) complex subunit e, mitochondrial n=1 Tax=Acartia pacifica TaxID=335913 RepID=A0A0U2IG60_ACAPC|nr:ATP synthase E chain [Acartia pacifica]ALS04373.1 ATP synthase E chain [Acartia pacifica]
MALPEPVRVSPLIKTCRWSALIAGIYWGSYRYKVHKAAADERRAYEAKMKPIWDAEAAEKKNAANRKELIYLATATGTPIPKDF